MADGSEPWLDLSHKVSDEARRSPLSICACRCGINGVLSDGKVSYIEGSRDHPVNRGVPCANGSTGVKQHDSPARLRRPLKRSAPRGSGEFPKLECERRLRSATRSPATCTRSTTV